MEATDLVGLGDDPALEFVNTTAVPTPGTLFELLGDGGAYLAWLEQIGLIDGDERISISAAFTGKELDAVAEEARELREWIRPVIATWSEASDEPLPTAVTDRLNEILRLDRRFTELRDHDGHTEAAESRHWVEPRQLLVPPVEAIARLLATGDRQLVRNCEGCTVWFYDHTKAHRRRWCSMALCGNRAKAHNHRQRAALDTNGS